MAKQATFKEYTVTIEDNGSVTVSKDGKNCDNNKAALREISEKIGFKYDPEWTTRQLGTKIFNEISKGETKNEKESSKFKDPFEGQMVKVCAGSFYHYFYSKKYVEPHSFQPRDRRCKRVYIEGYYEDVAHSRRVTISNGFQIGKYPVTEGQWKIVMGEKSSQSNLSWWGDDFPMQNVSWDDAQEFIEKLNQLTGKRYRLPTDAEWSLAAIGNYQTDDIYAGTSWYSDLRDYAWYDQIQLHPVGQKKPNAFGLYDMSGNIWEWCQDWYEDVLDTSDVIDPKGPASGTYRVLHGGDYISNDKALLVRSRNFCSPSNKGLHYGFRLCL